MTTTVSTAPLRRTQTRRPSTGRYSEQGTAAWTPRVSFNVVVRDGARYISGALRSLTRQTYPDFEVVVVDDGSQDETARLVERHACDDARIRLIRARPIGLVAARNLALAHSIGEFVAVHDADDLAMRHRLEVQVAEMDANPAAVAVGAHGWRINEWGLPIGRLRTGPVGRAGYRARRRAELPFNLTHSSVLARRARLERAEGYPIHYENAEDCKLLTRLAALGEVYAIPQSLVLYRVHGESYSARRMLEGELSVLRVREELARGHDYASFGAFLDDMAQSGGWETRRRAIEHRVARRQVGRALARGDLLSTARLLREGQAPPSVVAALLHRVATGR